MNKLERLLNLTMTLLEAPRPLTAAEIRDRIPGYPDNEAAFRRAFERDKESLREMGIPLQRTEKAFTDPPVDGYRIAREDYYLRDPGLERDELAALHLAASAVRLDPVHGQEALWKLAGVAGGADVPPPPAVTGGPGSLGELPNDPNLGPVFNAVADRRRLTFTYRGERREIDPHRLDFRRGRWYVTGFDHARGEERNFRLDRIDGEVRTGPPDAFTRPSTAVPGGPAQPWQFREEPPVTARLLVDRHHAAWARRELQDTAAITERPDGAIEAEVEVTNWPAFRSFVLTFLEHAEILGPPSLRARMEAWLEAFA